MFRAFNLERFLVWDFCRGSFASIKMLNVLVPSSEILFITADFIANMIGMFTDCFLELEENNRTDRGSGNK